MKTKKLKIVTQKQYDKLVEKYGNRIIYGMIQHISGHKIINTEAILNSKCTIAYITVKRAEKLISAL